MLNVALKRLRVAVSPDIEWVSVEHRTFSGIIICLDVTVGNCIGVGIAYCVNEWRMLILAVTSPLVLSVIAWRYWHHFHLKALRNATSLLKSAQCCFRWLPESARWLLANGKADAAHHYIMKCAEVNNRTKCLETVTPQVFISVICISGTVGKWWLEDLFISSQTLLESVENQSTDKKYTFLDIVKTPNIRKLSICIGIIWWVSVVRKRKEYVNLIINWIIMSRLI